MYFLNMYFLRLSDFSLVAVAGLELEVKSPHLIHSPSYRSTVPTSYTPHPIHSSPHNSHLIHSTSYTPHSSIAYNNIHSPPHTLPTSYIPRHTLPIPPSHTITYIPRLIHSPPHTFHVIHSSLLHRMHTFLTSYSPHLPVVFFGVFRPLLISVYSGVFKHLSCLVEFPAGS